MGADGGCMRNKFGGVRLRDRNFRCRKLKKMDKVEAVHLGSLRY